MPWKQKWKKRKRKNPSKEPLRFRFLSDTGSILILIGGLIALAVLVASLIYATGIIEKRRLEEVESQQLGG